MSNVISLRSFLDAASPPTLVLVEMQRERVMGSGGFAGPDVVEAIANCRAALKHARSSGFPIALVRWSGSANGRPTNSRWIEGFEPRRTDMVFQRNRPSCFASSAFAEVMANVRGSFVLAGFAGDGACLATAIDAFHRGHRVTFLSDASVSRRLDDIAAFDVHRTVSGIIGNYGEAMHTRAWIAATSHWEKRLERKNGNERGRTAR